MQLTLKPTAKQKKFLDYRITQRHIFSEQWKQRELEYRAVGKKMPELEVLRELVSDLDAKKDPESIYAYLTMNREGMLPRKKYFACFSDVEIADGKLGLCGKMDTQSDPPDGTAEYLFIWRSEEGTYTAVLHGFTAPEPEEFSELTHDDFGVPYAPGCTSRDDDAEPLPEPPEDLEQQWLEHVTEGEDIPF